MDLTAEQRREIEAQADRIMQERRSKGLYPARVFCVSCGAGKRTPLRRWHNSYICSECWKILQAIGEEKFIETLRTIRN